MLALVLAAANALFVGPRVSELRKARYAEPPEVARQAAEAFGWWHGCGLIMDAAGLLLVAGALVLAAVLPDKAQAGPNLVPETPRDAQD